MDKAAKLFRAGNPEQLRNFAGDYRALANAPLTYTTSGNASTVSYTANALR